LDISTIECDMLERDGMMTSALEFWRNTSIHDASVWIELSIHSTFCACVMHECHSANHLLLVPQHWGVVPEILVEGVFISLSPDIRSCMSHEFRPTAKSPQTNHSSHSDDSWVCLQSSWGISFSRSSSAILLLVSRSMSHRTVVRVNGRYRNVDVTCDPIQLSKASPERKCNKPKKTHQASNHWSRIARRGSTRYRVHKKWLKRHSHSDPWSSS
jgi:hypothetical protein